MKYVKNIGIVIGFWLIGFIISLVLSLLLDLKTSIFDSVNRDFSIGFMFLFISIYFKKPYYYFLAFIMFYFGGSQIYNDYYFPDQNKSEKKVFIQQLIDKSAEELNKKTPFAIDSETKLITVIPLKNSLKYIYSMTTMLNSEINQEYLHTKFINNVKSRTCSSKELEVYFTNGASIIYQYNDKNGDFIISIEVVKSDCDKEIIEDYRPIQ